jgi:adenylosuccinate synthase
LKFSILINGVTKLVVTKVDVLNAFEEIGVCTKYAYQGTESDVVPFDLSTIPVEPIYEMVEGWQADLEGTNLADLPPQLTDYIHYLEERLDTKVSSISTGPEREKIIDNQAESVS